MLANIHKLWIVLAAALSLAGAPEVQAQSTSVAECIEVALANNRSLQAGRNNLRVYALKQEEIRSNRWPRATLAADYRYFTHLPYQLLPLSVFNGPEGQFREAQFGVPHNIGAQMQLTIPLYQPQVSAGIVGAEMAMAMGELQMEKNEEQVIYEVSGLYYNAQILQQQLLFVDNNLSNTARLLRNMQLLQTQGMAKGTDVSKMELQQAQLQSQREQLATNLQQAIHGLNFTMGRDLDAPLSIFHAIDTTGPERIGIPAPVDIRIAEVQHRLLSNEKDLLKRSRLPTVSFTAQYGLSGFGYTRQPEPFLKVFPLGFIGLQVHYPVWNRTTRHKIAQQEVNIQGQEMLAEHIAGQHELQSANALLQKRTAQRRLPVIQQQITWAEKVYKQTIQQQEQGIATLTDILVADQALREAQTNYLQAMVDYLKADLDWRKSSGALKY